MSKRRKAIKLLEKCKIDLPGKGECSLDIVKQFEEALDIQITIVDAKKFLERKYTGEERKKGKICLLLVDNHYHYITSMAALHEKEKYCYDCMKPYQKDNKHKCVENGSFLR